MGKPDLLVSWDDYHRLVEELALQVHESAWAFDAIVCLARGGLRVGDILSRVFERPLGVLFTSTYREAAGREQGTMQVGEHICSAAPLPGGSWLLVDDLVDSGHTLAAIVQVLRQRRPDVRALRSGVIWQKARSVFEPDYVVCRLPDSPWIRQPFEAYDTLRPDALREQAC